MYIRFKTNWSVAEIRLRELDANPHKMNMQWNTNVKKKKKNYDLTHRANAKQIFAKPLTFFYSEFLTLFHKLRTC